MSSDGIGIVFDARPESETLEAGSQMIAVKHNGQDK